MPKPAGALKIFTFAGINVYLHWTWAVVAIIQLQMRRDSYSNHLWSAAEYLTLFLIVLLHEFGHALACRQVGGRAETILLWPLGGVAFVQPPPRPGAHLWSIVAGPLVNVVLLLPTIALAYWAGNHVTSPDAREFCFMVAVINGALLAFNLLPIYPLDGGQIFRSLLWFFVGPVNSLIVASLVGLVAASIGLVISLRLAMTWMAVMAGFAAWQSWMGFSRARAFVKFQKLPRHAHAACPNCRAHPPAAPIWQCDSCGQAFDMIATHAICPRCRKQFDITPCAECGRPSPISEWISPPRLAPSSFADFSRAS